jgi:hypothetical protein
MDTGHWNISCEPINELPYGFLYIITNTTTNRKYIGKKQIFRTVKRPPLKGKKNKRHIKMETDWKLYTSSSNELNEDILIIGKEYFKFEIVRWCHSKSELAYYEAKMQFECDVLLTDDYYNGIINLRIGRLKCV